MRGSSWTSADDELLRLLYGQVPIREISARLNRSQEACAARAGSLRLTKPKGRVNVAGEPCPPDRKA